MWTSVGTARTYTVQSLTNMTPYTFQVRAKNVAGYGPSSTTTATPSEVSVPSVPQNVQGTGGLRYARFTWEAPESDGNSPILRYEYSAVPIHNPGLNPWIRIGLTHELEFTQARTGTHKFLVRAVNAIGPGPASEQIAVQVRQSDPTTPSEPQGLSIDTDNSSRAKLKWGAVANPGNSPVTGYRIEVCQERCDDETSWTVLVADTGGTGVRWTHEGLAPGVIRKNIYRVKAINSAQGAGEATMGRLPPTEVWAFSAAWINHTTVVLRISVDTPDGMPIYVRYWKAGDWSTLKHKQYVPLVDGGISPQPSFGDLTASTTYRVEMDFVDTFDSPRRQGTTVTTPQEGTRTEGQSPYQVPEAGVDIDVNGDGVADENGQIRMPMGGSGTYRLRLRPCEGRRTVHTRTLRSPAGALQGTTPATAAPTQMALECADTEPGAWQTVTVTARSVGDYPEGPRLNALLSAPLKVVYSHDVYIDTEGGDGEGLVSSGTGTTNVQITADPSATIAAPTGLGSELVANRPRTVRFTWDPVPEATGYYIKWGNQYEWRHGTQTGLTLSFAQPVTWDIKVRVRAFNTSSVSAWAEIRRRGADSPTLYVDDTEAHEETNAKMRFRVRLAPAALWEVRVRYATVNDTAIAGSDYTATWGTLTFAAGETEKTVSVPVIDDGEADSGERFKLRLQRLRGRTLNAGIGRRDGYGTIRNTEELGARFARSRFASTSHAGAGTQAQVAVAFSEAVAAFAKTTPSVTVTGGSVASVRRHAEAALTHAWMFFIEPSGTQAVTFTLVADAACDAGGICTADARVLKEVPGARTLPGPGDAPVIDDTDTFTVAENTTHVARLGASDADTTVESLTWSIPDRAAGGADGAAFTITTDGVLSFAAAKDFEAPDDTDADGVYEVTVRVGDGTSDAEAALRVRVADVDDTAPALASAQVNASTLVLGFDEALDTAKKPAIATFAVTVNDEARTVDSVTLAERSVTLTLESAVVTADTVTVAYTAPADPDARRLRDAAGNAAPSFASHPVSNATPVPGNEPPTGVPTISGTAQVNETLTASVDGIDDPDGRGDGTFSYRWLANDRATESEIEGATAATYTPVAADTGKTLRVEAVFTDGKGTRETVVSAPTRAVAAATPQVSIARSRAHIPEGADATFTLTRVGDIAQALTVTVTVEETGTVLGAPVPSTATFAAGASETTLGVPTDGDTTREIDGTVTVRLEAGTGYRLARLATSASVTVLDDDPPQGAPGPAADVTVWSGDITVVDYENGSIGAGSANLITNEGGTAGLDAKWLWYRTAIRKVYLSFTEGVEDADGLTLHIGDVALVFPEGSSENAAFTWDNVDIAWTDGQIVAVRIARASTVPVSADATLRSLEISGATLAPAFSATGGLYTATVTPETEQITVSATTTQGEASAAYTPETDADPALDGHQIALPVGDTVVTADVTAPDGVTTREYRVVVTRPGAPITVAFAASAYTASEGAKAAAVAVTLDAEPDSDITIALIATPGGGASTGDYSAPPSVTFVAGEALTQTITVSAAIDADEESGEHVVLSFGTLPEGVVAGERAQATVALVDATNSAPTGRPTITGRERVGDTLTASGEAIDDADGLTGAAFSWQWFIHAASGDTAIEDASASTYTPAPGDAGKRLKVRATFTDDADTQESVLSAATVAVEAAPTVSEIAIAAGPSPVTEGNDATFTLTRTRPTTDAVTVTVQVTETGAMLSGTPPSEVTFEADAATATLRVATADDEAVEDSSTLTAALVAADGYTVIAENASATVQVDDDDAAPVVITESPLNASENTTAVATLEATDADTPTEDLAWRVSGGDDAGEFRLTEAGVLSFYRAPDFEAPGDADEDGTYEVKVLVSDGANHTEAVLEVQVSDVDDIAPALSSATVNATALTLNFDEALDETSQPPATAFTVTVGDTTRNVDQIALDGATATLTLASAVASGEAVTVSYTVPKGLSATPLADSAGNTVAAFSGEAVTNETPAPDNTAATGQPEITGTAQVGQTLTATTDAIDDADGITGVTFTYQWIANDGNADTSIEDASEATYTVAPGDVGKTLKVRVSFTDGAGNAEAVTSEATEPVTANVPGAPGEAQASTPPGSDGALAVSWSAPASDGGAEVTAYRVQWKSGAEDYDTTPGSTRQAEVTERTHTITGLGNGVEHTLRIVAVNTAGAGEGAEVSATPSDRAAPALTSATVKASTLTLHFNEALDEDSRPAAAAFAVEVESAARDVDAVAVTGSTLVLTLASGVAKDETVTVSYTVPSAAGAAALADSAGNTVAAFSGEAVTNETPAPGNRAPNGLPTITGTAQVGETLSASTSAITDADGLEGVTFAYQWIANDGAADTDIEDATTATYTALPNDVGKTLKVRVTFIDEGETEETLTSAATVPIAAALTASFEDTPESHDGASAFTVELRFSEDIEMSFVTMRDDALEVSGGNVTGAERLARPTNTRWKITIEPTTQGAVTIAVPANQACSETGAICTDDGRRLSTAVSLSIPGPASANTSATGQPEVSGTPQVGETLTASTAAIEDAQGLANVSFAFQWIANDATSDADIEEATEATYTVAPADVGNTLKVRITFTDDAENAETATSEATVAVTASVPGAPTDIEASTPSGSDGELAVSWSAPPSNGGAAISGYRIAWKSGAQDYDTTGESTRQAQVTERAYTMSGLDNGVEVTIEVRAVNTAGAGAGTETTATPRDRAAPTLSSATVSGATLTLTFNETLDEDSAPATDAFAVDVDETARSVDSRRRDGERRGAHPGLSRHRGSDRDGELHRTDRSRGFADRRQRGQRRGGAHKRRGDERDGGFERDPDGTARGERQRASPPDADRIGRHHRRRRRARERHLRVAVDRQRRHRGRRHRGCERADLHGGRGGSGQDAESPGHVHRRGRHRRIARERGDRNDHRRAARGVDQGGTLARDRREQRGVHPQAHRRHRRGAHGDGPGERSRRRARDKRTVAGDVRARIGANLTQRRDRQRRKGRGRRAGDGELKRRRRLHGGRRGRDRSGRRARQRPQRRHAHRRLVRRHDGARLPDRRHRGGERRSVRQHREHRGAASARALVLHPDRQAPAQAQRVDRRRERAHPRHREFKPRARRGERGQPELHLARHRRRMERRRHRRCAPHAHQPRPRCRRWVSRSPTRKRKKRPERCSTSASPSMRRKAARCRCATRPPTGPRPRARTT